MSNEFHDKNFHPLLSTPARTMAGRSSDLQLIRSHLVLNGLPIAKILGLGLNSAAQKPASNRRPSVFFVKEIFIYLLKLDGTVQPHADTVFDHQLRKALPIN